MRDVLVLSDRWDPEHDLPRVVNDLGFHAVIVSTRKEFGAALGGRPELVLIDLGKKGLNVVRLCRALHQDPRAGELPILLFGSDREIATLDITAFFDELLSLTAPAEEIQARVRRLLWRRKGVDTEGLVRAENLVINLAKYEVTLSGEPVTLTFKEYELLRFLATHPGRVFSRQYLLSQIWGLDYYGGMRTVDVHVRRLRAKLESEAHVFIETVRGAGYRFRG